MHKVFVYGSLKRGYGNNILLKDQQYLGEVSTVEGFDLISLRAFPAMLKTEGPRQVHGELYEVDDKCLQQLDILEGHPNLYIRQRISLDNGQQVWAYLFPTIEEGVW